MEIDLNAWEADAKEMQKALEAPGIYAPNCERILALISELREMTRKLSQESVEKDMTREQRDRFENENIRLTERNKWAEERLKSAAELLKEFAEATDEMVTACKQGYARDISKMERALQRWREWK